MTWLDKARARAHGVIAQLPGRAGELARKANDALGRPLADDAELADRRAFAAVAPPAAAAMPVASDAQKAREAAPVVLYHMDKTRRDADKLAELLEGTGIPYKRVNLEDDPAGQAAVRRDSKGHRLPVVFIAGEVVGGRTELTNLATSGGLSKKVFG
jgi:glutaredoxin